MALGDPVLNGVALLDDLPAGGKKITGLAAGAIAGDSARYDELNTLDGLAINKDGSVAFTADQPMGTKKLTGLGAPTVNGDALRFDQLGAASGIATLDAGSKVVQDPATAFIKKDGSVAFTGDQDMGTKKLTGLGAPTVANDALRYGVAEITDAEIAVGAAITFAKLEGVPALDNIVIKKDGSVAFTAAQSMGGFMITVLDGVEWKDDNISCQFGAGLTLRSAEYGANAQGSFNGASMICYGEDHGTCPGWIKFRSKNAGGFAQDRLTLKNGATVDALWEDCIHKGLKLGEALDANSQKVTGLLAPTAEGDAVSLGDPVLSGAEAAVVADVNVIGGIPVLHRIDIAAGALAETDVTLTHKSRVVDAWVVMTGAGVATTTLTVQNAANPITDGMDVSVADKSIVRAAEIDDDFHEIAGAGILRVKTEVGATQPACTVYVLCIRVA